jgi:hypothetical protein
MSLKKIILLREKIFSSNHCKLNKKCLWAACCTAFFGSFRCGELLAKGSLNFDKFSDLTWKDISKGKKHWSYHLKSPKIFNPKGEKVTLFPFPTKNLCPINAVSKLKKLSKQRGYGIKSSSFSTSKWIKFNNKKTKHSSPFNFP